MLLARGGEEAGPGTTQTQQNLGMLQNKWASLNTKMDDRRVRLSCLLFLITVSERLTYTNNFVVNLNLWTFQAKLDEAVSLATGFQTSLQDTINWLTQAEQTLNMAQPPSLMLDTVLFQIDEHKVLNMLLLLETWLRHLFGFGHLTILQSSCHHLLLKSRY